MKYTTDLSPDQYVVTHVVDPASTGVRLDRFLKERYRKRTRGTLQRAIESGAILLQRRQGPHVTVGKLKSSTQLLGGDEVLVVSDKKPEPAVNFNFKILYEDDVLLVIDKPANLPVHPAGRYFFHTLLIHLRTQGREVYLAHRIDKETSGVLVLAKTAEACTKLAEQFADRTTEKRYLAIVHCPKDAPAPAREFTVDAPLRRARNSRIELKMEVAPPHEAEEAQTALTHFHTLKTHTNPQGSFALLECLPKTGRQHQIRVHLEHAGHPIVGDKLYGRTEQDAWTMFERKFVSAEMEARLMLPRHALHAESISLVHPKHWPATGERVTFQAELPDDMRQFLEG